MLSRERKCLNTITFPPNLRCLTYIMLFNLYPVRKMTTMDIARAIFLMELQEKTYINIDAHVFSIIAEETRTTSRPKLVLPSLIMRILHEKGVKTPQDISLMNVPSTINSQTIIRSKDRLPGDEEVDDPEQEHPADIETEAEGQPPSSRRGGGHGKSGVSSFSSVPPDAFQIILERIDGLRDVQTEHSNRLTTIQDQINLLTAKFDSFANQH